MWKSVPNLSRAFALMKKISGLKIVHQLIVPLLGTSIYKVHTLVILTYLPSIQLQTGLYEPYWISCCDGCKTC